MKADYAPALQPRGVSVLRCGHTDCRYYTPCTDSCDYLLIEYERRGCPPESDCARYTPVLGPRAGAEGDLAACIQACTDMGWSVRRIARRLRLCESAVRLLRARGARAAGDLKKSEFSEKSGATVGDTP